MSRQSALQESRRLSSDESAEEWEIHTHFILNVFTDEQIECLERTSAATKEWNRRLKNYKLEPVAQISREDSGAIVHEASG